MNKLKFYLLAMVTFLIIGCSKEPKPISYGEDECEFCKMIVMDKRYGAELVTDKGKIFMFDSIECLVGYLDNQKISKDDYTSVWVGNYANPGNIIDAEKALYLKNDELRSPMGLNVLAVENQGQYDKLQKEFGGELVAWEALFGLVREM